jgi:hypothetical protein
MYLTIYLGGGFKMLNETEILENEFKNQTPEELNFNYDLSQLRQVAKVFNIKNRSKMNKIILCLNIEQYLIDKGLN